MDFWSKLIKVIDSPLGFFVLALLIVEGALTIILTTSSMPVDQIFSGLIVASILFVLVVLSVFLLVWFKPENLTFDRDSHLKRHEFGSGQEKVIEEVVTAGDKVSGDKSGVNQ